MSCSKQWQLLNSTSYFPVEGKAHYELFPLPLTLPEEDLRWDATASSPAHLQTTCPLPTIYRAWKHCLVLVLNTWALAPQSTNKNPPDTTELLSLQTRWAEALLKTKPLRTSKML